MLYLLQKHRLKKGIKAIENGGEIRINQLQLERKLGIRNISDKTQCYSSEFENLRFEMQECGKYQPCRMCIENISAKEITMSSGKTQATIFRAKFGVNQDRKLLRKQQSLSLRLKKLFPDEDIIEEYFALKYRTDFIFQTSC